MEREEALIYSPKITSCSSTVNPNVISTLIFSDPPFFIVRPQQYYQRQPTQSVTMPCVAEGDPKPDLTWRKVRQPTQSVTMPCIAEGDPKPDLSWGKVRL